ncbi:hypothetical protein L218DRAFT_995301 [Marasmius fiardii PR-910]|nr:hypothetical protein L218DRAFT_995301 [Marasmius fiardii PR-910]
MSFSVNIQDPELASHLYKIDVILFIEHAGLVVLIYDYFLTLGSEVSYVWTRGPWNFGKALFFLVRYPVFVSASLFFYGLKHVPVHTHISVRLVAERWALQLHLRNGYNRICPWAEGMGAVGKKQKVATCLVVTYIALLAYFIYKVAAIREAQDASRIEYYHVSGYCPPQFSGTSDRSSDISTITLAFIMFVVYESVVLVLTLIKASEQGWLRSHASGSRFVNAFISQGVAYNFLVLAASTANIITRSKPSVILVNRLVHTDLIYLTAFSP